MKTTLIFSKNSSLVLISAHNPNNQNNKLKETRGEAEGDTGVRQRGQRREVERPKIEKLKKRKKKKKEKKEEEKLS